ncbi:MAG: RNA 2',3'-cyclic phosphodiesterase, partial [bacterium]
MRVFFALWPPERSAARLAHWARDLAHDTGGRATRQETIHLTLAFLGEIEAARVDDAIAAARTVRAPAHKLLIEHAEFWPHNRILWVGPQRRPAPMARLARELGKALRRADFALERRPFAAHVTLIRKARTPRALPPLPKVDWPVDEFVLVRSLLSNEGAQYAVLE